jgi:TolA-binding protein
MRVTLVTLAAVAAIGGGAQAQTVVTDPAAIASCLCEQYRVETLHERATVAQRHYDEEKQRLDALDREVDERRATVDPQNEEQLDAFRRLLLQEETAKAHFFNQVLPHTQAVAGRYNRALAGYAPRCTGISYDPEALARAKATLVCPPEPLDQPEE